MMDRSVASTAIPDVRGIDLEESDECSNLVWSPLQLGFGDLLDGYGFAAAFAAIAVFQVLAALVLIPVRLRQTVRAVPSHP